MISFVMIGANGRMGQAILKVARDSALYRVAAEVGGGDNLMAKSEGADTLIDFSHHSATAGVVEVARKIRRPLIVGTTGHLIEELEMIHGVSKEIPVVLAPNFSVGVNLLFFLTRKAAEILGTGFDQEIIEMHHRLKLDAPSGTARRLGEVLAEVKGRPYGELVVHGRSGEPGKRSQAEIGMHSLRGGSVVGDHTVVFASEGERVELTHKASSRETFAAGALRAAAWSVGRDPGLYSMQDVLGLQ